MANEFSTALSTSLEEVKGALPNTFNRERFVQNAIALLNDSKALQDFAKNNGTQPIKMALLKSAYLDLDALNGEVYLIPYGQTVQVMPSYKGSVKVAKKYATRAIKDIYCKLVREGDEYSEEIKDGNQVVNYKAKPFSNAPIIGAFAVVQYEDGGFLVDSMSLEELETTRSQSKQRNSIPWQKFTGEMYKKVILHRLVKRIDISFDNPAQKAYFEEDMKIETDPKNIRDMEIEDSANKEIFVESTVVE